MTKRLIAFAAAVLILFAVSSGYSDGARADATSPGHAAKTARHAKMVGYCDKCNVYYSESDTKTMKMMDPEGHKLVLMPLSKVPKDAERGRIGEKETPKRHK